jgi:hypothetical protein
MAKENYADPNCDWVLTPGAPGLCLKTAKSTVASFAPVARAPAWRLVNVNIPIVARRLSGCSRK